MMPFAATARVLLCAAAAVVGAAAPPPAAAQAAAAKQQSPKPSSKPSPKTAAKQQGRWRQIGTTSSGNPVFLDPKSVKTAGGIVTATVRAVFVEPVKTPQGAWTSARTVAMFDCAKQKVAVKENTYFIDEKRNLIAQHKVVGIPGFGTTIKGTLADVALLHLCAAGK